MFLYVRVLPVVCQESLDAVYYIESSCHIANRTETRMKHEQKNQKNNEHFEGIRPWWNMFDFSVLWVDQKLEPAIPRKSSRHLQKL